MKSNATRILKSLTTDKLFILAILLAAICLWLFIQIVGKPNTSTWSLSGIALSIFIYPILEEIVFRGQLQAFLLRYKVRFLGLSLANLITSVVFSALHLLYQAPLWAIAIFVPSLIFGFFYDRYQSVIPSILLHIYYNAIFFLMLL